jgi:hypothetical protein
MLYNLCRLPPAHSTTSKATDDAYCGRKKKILPRLSSQGDYNLETVMGMD